MRAVRVENGSVCVVDVPSPQGDGVRVKMKAAGICGSDLHMIEHGATMGVTLGHELAGELPDGRPVAIEPLAPCETCEFCVAGDYQLCRSAPQMIFGIMRDGGMADELIVPPRCIVPLPNGVAARDASLVEPLAVCRARLPQDRPARRAARRRDRRRLDRPAAPWRRRASPAPRSRSRRATIASANRASASARRAIDGEYDVVVECAGSESAVQRMCELAKPGGTIMLLSSYWGPLALPGFLVMLKELRLQPSSMYGRHSAGRDIEAAAALLAADPGIPGAIITHRLPLDAAPEAFASRAIARRARSRWCWNPEW